MKKYLFTIVLTLLCSVGYAQQANSIFKQLKHEPNAEVIHISPFLMSIGKLFSNAGKGTEIVSKIKSMKVLDIEKCNANTKKRFDKCIDALDPTQYETLIRINDSGERVRILTKQHKGYIRELLIACSEKNECTLILMNGKISPKDIDQLVAEQTKKKNGRHSF